MATAVGDATGTSEGSSTTTNTTNTTNITNTTNTSTSRGGRDRSSAANSEHNKIAKKGWNDWADEVRPVLHVTGRSAKPEYETLASLLHQSYRLPEIMASPGTADQHLFETMLALQNSLSDHVSKVAHWVSQSHDLLSGSVYTRSASTGKGGTLLLEQHVTRSKQLGVRAPGIDGLKHSARAVRTWKSRAGDLMKMMVSLQEEDEEEEDEEDEEEDNARLSALLRAASLPIATS